MPNDVESILFLDEFVSNWFLLHEEDMWIMPDEVLSITRCIKEGQPEKVDWPGLIWFMVEKELSQGTKLKSCYYASHLQHLMRYQKDVLFKEEPKLEEEEEEKEENAEQQQQVRDDDEDVMDFQEPGDYSWENKASGFVLDYCMDQINSWAVKAIVNHAQKDEDSMNAKMNQEYLMSELRQRDDMIATLHKTKCEEIQRREIEMYKLEHELRMMSNLLVGYRTTLKQTQREFSEYRERCPEPEEEPLYKDVPGGGGLVLSTRELEKLRLEREEEEKMQRRFYEELIKKIEGSCIATLEVSEERVHLLDKSLLKLDEEFKLLLSAKHKMPEAHKMPEEEGCIAEEEKMQLRLEREEEEKMQCSFLEKLMKKFEGGCIDTLEASKEKVHLLDKKLLELEQEFKVRKEIFALFGN